MRSPSLLKDWILNPIRLPSCALMKLFAGGVKRYSQP